MVVKKHSFSTCGLAPGDHRLPRIGQSSSENVLCSDEIGVCTVTAAHTDEVLSSSTFFRHLSTGRTCSGGVSRIDRYQKNTVLLSQHIDPFNDLPISPRGDCLAKTFASTGLLTQLQIFQSLDTKTLLLLIFLPYILYVFLSTSINKCHFGTMLVLTFPPECTYRQHLAYSPFRLHSAHRCDIVLTCCQIIPNSKLTYPRLSR
jgi:hypothetical protein